MDYRDWLITDVAKDAENRITEKTINELRELKNNSLLSGDDSPLANIWEEICVQVQFEQSFYWKAYEYTTISIIERLISKDKEFVKQALWLQTEPGCSWQDYVYDYEEQVKDYSEYLRYKRENRTPFDCNDIAKYIFREILLVEAANYSNKRTERYIESSYNY